MGWKLGVGDAERIGETVAVGHLTETTTLESGTVYATNGAHLRADAEVAVVVGLGYAAALELVDLGNADAGAEDVVATNIFHRAVAFGPVGGDLPAQGTLLVNGVARASDAVADVLARMRSAERVLAAVGERFERGDRVITGSVVQLPVHSGDEVAADFGALGRVSLTLA